MAIKCCQQFLSQVAKNNFIERVLLVIILAAVDISVVICHDFGVGKGNIANLKKIFQYLNQISPKTTIWSTLHLKQFAWNEAPGILSRLPSKLSLHLLHLPNFLLDQRIGSE